MKHLKIYENFDPLEEESLDPVGQEDEDINNDGKEDEQDEYLKKRREKISSELEEAVDHDYRERAELQREKDQAIKKFAPRLEEIINSKEDLIAKTKSGEVFDVLQGSFFGGEIYSYVGRQYGLNSKHLRNLWGKYYKYK